MEPGTLGQPVAWPRLSLARVREMPAVPGCGLHPVRGPSLLDLKLTHPTSRSAFLAPESTFTHQLLLLSFEGGEAADMVPVLLMWNLRLKRHSDIAPALLCMCWATCLLPQSFMLDWDMCTHLDSPPF